MSAQVVAFPNWKPNATAAERFDELAGLARAAPEMFKQFVVCYKESLPNGNARYRHLQFGCTLPEEIGLFEIGKSDTLKDSE